MGSAIYIVTTASTEHKRSKTSTQWEKEECNKLNPENEKMDRINSNFKKNKRKSSPYNKPRRPRGGVGGYSSTLSLTSALDGSGWSTSRPSHFAPGKPRYPLYERLGRPQRFDPRTVQPVVSLKTIKSNYLFSVFLTKLKQSVQTPLAAKCQHFHAISCWG